MFAILKVIAGNYPKEKIILEKGSNLIGRSSKSTIFLDSEMISRKHATLLFDGVKAFIEDLGSANGININGKPVKSAYLKNHDRVFIGNFVFEIVFSQSETALLEKTVARGSISEPKKAEVINEVFSATNNLQQPEINLINDSSEFKPTIIEFKEDNKFTKAFKEAPFQDNPVQSTGSSQKVSGKLADKLDRIDFKFKLLLLIGFSFIFIFYFLVLGLIEYNQASLLKDAVIHAKALVRLLGEENKNFLFSGDDMLLDITKITSEKGVVKAYIIDETGKIRAPVSLQGTNINDVFTNRALIEGKLVDNMADPESFNNRAFNGEFYELAYPIKIWDEKEVGMKTIGIARLTFLPLKVLPSSFETRKMLFLYALLLLVPLVILGFLLLNLTSTPIKNLKDQVEAVIKGDLKEVKKFPFFLDYSTLIDALNRMVTKTSFSSVENKQEISSGFSFDASTGKEKEFELIFSGVNDGILIIDSTKTIKAVNDSAVNLLKLSFNGGMGKLVSEVINEKELLDEFENFFEILKKDATHEKDIGFGGPGMTLRIKGLRKTDVLGEVSDYILIFNFI